MKPRLILTLACFLCAAVVQSPAADWPQFRGPNRDGVSKETGLLKAWPTGGPPLAWTFDKAGAGYSGPAIVGDHLYLAGARGESEYVIALDTKAGKELWAAKIGPTFTWKGNGWNAGPSATPTVGGGMVYALGGRGELVCVDAAKGGEVWRKSMPKDLAGEVNPIGGSPEKIGWGYTWSPLVDGDQVICTPGGPQGTLGALDKKTGKVLWRSKELTDQATYSSPVAAEIGGVRQYVQMTNAGVAGVAAKDGALLWYYKREEPYNDIVASTPLVRDNLVFISAAEGCDLVKVAVDGAKFNAEKVYANNSLANFHGGMVLVGDDVYGASGALGPRSKWVCLKVQDGKVAWANEDRRLGKGSLTYADGNLYCYGEKQGLVVLAEASPRKWTPKGQFSLPQESKLRLDRGGYWTHPVVANGKLYLRDQELLFCYDVKAK